jgi:hypothetical protein
MVAADLVDESFLSKNLDITLTVDRAIEDTAELVLAELQLLPDRVGVRKLSRAVGAPRVNRDRQVCIRRGGGGTGLSSAFEGGPPP